MKKLLVFFVLFVSFGLGASALFDTQWYQTIIEDANVDDINGIKHCSGAQWLGADGLCHTFTDSGDSNITWSDANFNFWRVSGNQSGLSGDKNGSYNINTTGTANVEKLNTSTIDPKSATGTIDVNNIYWNNAATRWEINSPLKVLDTLTADNIDNQAGTITLVGSITDADGTHTLDLTNTDLWNINTNININGTITGNVISAGTTSPQSTESLHATTFMRLSSASTPQVRADWTAFDDTERGGNGDAIGLNAYNDNVHSFIDFTIDANPIILNGGYYEGTGNVLIGKPTDDATGAPLQVNGSGNFGTGTPISGLNQYSYNAISGESGQNAGLTINRFSDSEYSSLDFITGADVSTGWSIQLQPSTTNLVINDRINNATAISIVPGSKVRMDLDGQLVVKGLNEPTTGAGMEMYYAPTGGYDSAGLGSVQVYDRDASVFREFQFAASKALFLGIDFTQFRTGSNVDAWRILGTSGTNDQALVAGTDGTAINNIITAGDATVGSLATTGLTPETGKIKSTNSMEIQNPTDIGAFQIAGDNGTAQSYSTMTLWGSNQVGTPPAWTFTHKYGNSLVWDYYDAGWNHYIPITITPTKMNLNADLNILGNQYTKGTIAVGKTYSDHGGYANAIDLNGGISIQRTNNTLNTYLLSAFNVAGTNKAAIYLDAAGSSGDSLIYKVNNSPSQLHRFYATNDSNTSSEVLRLSTTIAKFYTDINAGINAYVDQNIINNRVPQLIITAPTSGVGGVIDINVQVKDYSGRNINEYYAIECWTSLTGAFGTPNRAGNPHFSGTTPVITGELISIDEAPAGLSTAISVQTNSSGFATLRTTATLLTDTNAWTMCEADGKVFAGNVTLYEAPPE